MKFYCGIDLIQTNNNMALNKSKQVLANLIQAYDMITEIARSGYDDEELKDWFVNQSLHSQEKSNECIKKLNDIFSIDYNSDSAKKQVIKSGSDVEVLVNHMDGMKGSTATIKSYSIPSMRSDITMMDGMEIKNHKWLTNDEVKLK